MDHPWELVTIEGPGDPRFATFQALLVATFDEEGLEVRHFDAPHHLVAAVTPAGEMVAAAACLVRVDADDYADYLAAKGVELPTVRPVGELSQIGVVPAWRRRGLGSALVAHRLAWLADAGCAAAVVSSWLHPGADRSLSVLAAAGFVELGRVDAMWAGEWNCPYHGIDDTCAAAVCWRPLTPTPSPPS